MVLLGGASKLPIIDTHSSFGDRYYGYELIFVILNHGYIPHFKNYLY